VFFEHILLKNVCFSRINEHIILLEIELVREGETLLLFPYCSFSFIPLSFPDTVVLSTSPPSHDGQPLPPLAALSFRSVFAG
jgi:hypothetical protein